MSTGLFSVRICVYKDVWKDLVCTQGMTMIELLSKHVADLGYDIKPIIEHDRWLCGDHYTWLNKNELIDQNPYIKQTLTSFKIPEIDLTAGPTTPIHPPLSRMPFTNRTALPRPTKVPPQHPIRNSMFTPISTPLPSSTFIPSSASGHVTSTFTINSPDYAHTLNSNDKMSMLSPISMNEYTPTQHSSTPFSNLTLLDRMTIISSPSCHLNNIFSIQSPDSITHFSIQISIHSHSEMLSIRVSSMDLIGQVKQYIGQQAQTQLQLQLFPMQRHILMIPGASFLTDETQLLKSLPYIHNCLMRGNTIPILILFDKSDAHYKWIKKRNLEIGSLIGRPLSWMQQDGEVASFTQSMAHLRQKQASLVPQNQNTRAGLSIHMGELIVPANGSKQTLVQLRLELLHVKKMVIVSAQETADQFIQRHVEKYYIKKGLIEKDWSHYILKVTGLAEFIYGPYPFHSFDYVRECVIKKKEIDLVLIHVEDATGMEDGSDIGQDLSTNLVLVDDPSLNYIQDEITIPISALDVVKMKCISIQDLNGRLKFQVIGIEHIQPNSPSFISALTSSSSSKVLTCDEVALYMSMSCDLYHGGELIGSSRTLIIPSSSNPHWYELVDFEIKLCDLPRAVRICFTLWAGKRQIRSESDVALAWVNVQLFDYKHELKMGLHSFNMWPDDRANPIGTCVQNKGESPATLYIEFQSYLLPVVFPTHNKNILTYHAPITMRHQDQERLHRIISMDPLVMLNKEEKQLMWRYREFCKPMAKALPKFLSSVPCDYNAVLDMHRLLYLWTPIEPIDALELLDSKFVDSKIRSYAVDRLALLSTDELLDYLLQLVQALKYEPYHDTSLARMLLRLALNNKVIGCCFFWFLKSELHVPEISDRFCLLLEAYLRGCNSQMIHLVRQHDLQQRLVSIANMIKSVKDQDRLSVLHEELSKVMIPQEGVGIPLNPRIRVIGIKVSQCKYMDSKKLPLWIVFKNADVKGVDPYVIFKSGDDLRQDMLTLQLIGIMDHLWKKEGLDLHLNPYACISTGNEVGMIEVVLNSMTTAAITRTAGGAKAAFREDPIANWLRDQNPTDSAYRLAVDKFIMSCAGYCVATYVLGIGDRHNDNIMITKDGRLFHIDFGHFLGNFKKKFGVKRERAPFVFTPDFAYVMGGRDAVDFTRFLKYCQVAYNIVRKNANIFINLFAMMLSTGIPELKTVDDIYYLRDAFSLGLSDEQAAEKFTQLVYESMTTRTTQINNALHILAH